MWEGRNGVKGCYYCGEEGLPCIQPEPLAWMNSQEILCPCSLDLGCSRSHGQALYSTQRTVNSAHTWWEPKRQNHRQVVNVNSKSSSSLCMVVTLCQPLTPQAFISSSIKARSLRGWGQGWSFPTVGKFQKLLSLEVTSKQMSILRGFVSLYLFQY